MVVNLIEVCVLCIGSLGYFWWIVDDFDVCEDYQIFEGCFIIWDNFLVVDCRIGRCVYVGCIYGCCCWVEVVFLKD